MTIEILKASYPKGQYGGGTVIVWDEGTYEPAEAKFDDKTQMEKNLLHNLHKGKIVFTLHGQKLKGDYALVRSSYQGENSWLLMKVKDKYAKTSDVTKKDKSVVSGKTIKQIEKSPGNIWQSNRNNGDYEKNFRLKRASRTLSKQRPQSMLEKNKKCLLTFSPCLPHW